MAETYYYAYIGTNSVRGSRGIYCLKINAETLRTEITDTCDFYNAGGIDLSRDEKALYAACEGMTFHGYADGGIARFTVGDGCLAETGWALGKGQRTCCVSVSPDDKTAAAASFMNGMLTLYRVSSDGKMTLLHEIPTPKVEHMPEALHCVKIIGNHEAAVISITEDAVILYDLESGSRTGFFGFEKDEHPRYLECREDIIYAMLQEPGYIYVLKNKPDEKGILPMLQKVSVLPADFEGRCETTTLRITPDGRVLIAASRGNNSLSVFAVQADGTLKLKRVFPLHSVKPRDFNISRDGKLAVVACQQSDEVYVYRINAEKYMIEPENYEKIDIPSPAAVMVGNVTEGA